MAKAALVYAKPLQLYDLLRDLFLVWIKPTTHVKWRFSPRTLELTRRALTDRDTIVIGTSCGGVAALTELLGGLPGELSASVLIVMHTSPDSPRLLADILARCTTLKVAYGQHGHSVEPGHVYIAPPDYHMTVLCPGVVRLDQGPKVRFSRPAFPYSGGSLWPTGHWRRPDGLRRRWNRRSACDQRCGRHHRCSGPE